MSKDVLTNSYKHENTLHISVKNLGKFEELMEDVEKKQQELEIALKNLYTFSLEISFQVDSDD